MNPCTSFITHKNLSEQRKRPEGWLYLWAIEWNKHFLQAPLLPNECFSNQQKERGCFYIGNRSESIPSACIPPSQRGFLLQEVGNHRKCKFCSVVCLQGYPISWGLLTSSSKNQELYQSTKKHIHLHQVRGALTFQPLHETSSLPSENTFSVIFSQ